MFNSQPGYRFDCPYADLPYQRNAFVRSSLDWRWVGVLHEYLDCSDAQPWTLLCGPLIVVNHDSARARDPGTYLRDVAALERDRQDEPDNTRYMFYLGKRGFIQCGIDRHQWGCNARRLL